MQAVITVNHNVAQYSILTISYFSIQSQKLPLHLLTCDKYYSFGTVDQISACGLSRTKTFRLALLLPSLSLSLPIF